MKCCARCRLLQQESATCIECGAEALVAPHELAIEVLAGVTAVGKAPPTGLRDRVALYTTALATCASLALPIALGSPRWLLAPAGVAAFGYTKQFWRAKLRRTVRLRGVAMASPPAGQPFGATVAAHAKRLADPADAVAITTTYLYDGKLLLRRSEAVPFWLIADDRRVLVDTVLHVATNDPEPSRRNTAAAELAQLGVPLRRRERKHVALVRSVLRPGDRVSAIGVIEPRQFFDGSYRDNVVDGLRGEAGRPAWLARI